MMLRKSCFALLSFILIPTFQRKKKKRSQKTRAEKIPTMKHVRSLFLNISPTFSALATSPCWTLSFFATGAGHTNALQRWGGIQVFSVFQVVSARFFIRLCWPGIHIYVRTEGTKTNTYTSTGTMRSQPRTTASVFGSTSSVKVFFNHLQEKRQFSHE